MASDTSSVPITIGVLALQGAFNEHIQLLRSAAEIITSKSSDNPSDHSFTFSFLEVRNESELISCDALIIPGGESTAISLVAQRSNLLEPLRDFVKLHRNPVWGTCAGLILLSESANRTKKGGQELIGGLDVRVNRNHFGRQTESFQAELDLPFLSGVEGNEGKFSAIFIRAPIVEKVLTHVSGVQEEEAKREETVVAPSREISEDVKKVVREVEKVEIMGRVGDAGDIVAVRQGNVFGTSFHPELTGDARIHVWWLREVGEAVVRRRNANVSK